MNSIVQFLPIILGFLAGLACYHFLLNKKSSDQGDIKKQLQDLQNEFSTYKDGVSDHFVGTADLVNDLTESYRKVHQHLSNGAQSLSTEDGQNFLGRPNFVSLTSDDADSSADNYDAAPAGDATEAPRDYAPKQDPEEKGTLAEDYGLEQETSGDRNTSTGIPHISDIDSEALNKEEEAEAAEAEATESKAS